MNEENKINSKNDNTSLQDYEIETPEKKGFFTSLINKLGLGKNQKLLTSGENTKVHTTNRSISSMMAFGNFRANLFQVFDNIQKLFNLNKKELEPENTLKTQIIGQDYTNINDKSAEKANQDKKIIKPQNLDISESFSNPSIISHKPQPNVDAPELDESKSSLEVVDIEIDEEEIVNSKENIQIQSTNTANISSTEKKTENPKLDDSDLEL